MEIYEIIGAVLGFLVTAVFAVRVVFSRVYKAIDELEDVVTAGINIVKEGHDVLTSLLSVAEIKQNGTVVIKAENYKQVVKEAKEVGEGLEVFKKEAAEAVAAAKEIFKKVPKEVKE
jgi:hypothetical protein